MLNPAALSLAPYDATIPDDLSPHGALAVLAPHAAEHARQMEPAVIADTTRRHGPAVTAAALGLAPLDVVVCEGIPGPHGIVGRVVGTRATVCGVPVVEVTRAFYLSPCLRFEALRFTRAETGNWSGWIVREVRAPQNTSSDPMPTKREALRVLAEVSR